MGSNSIVQKLQHSDILRGRYARYVRELQHNPVWHNGLRNLSAAKHRFDTWQKPFARLVLTFDAVLSTAQAIHEERRMEATGRHARMFLEAVDEEMLVALAMMADAGEESIELTRFLDSEHADKTELSEECSRFLDRITVLFDRRGCLVCGYTAFMLQMLQKERVVYIDHHAKSIGGRTQRQLAPAIETNLKRLQQWAILARSVLRAEMPEFESVQAFGALRLTTFEERRKKFGDAEEERQELSDKLQKLANLLDLEPNALTEQFFDHLPVAQACFDREGCNTFAAWKKAVESVHGKHATRKHPFDQLLIVLIRASAWGISTSGVEQTFPP